MLNTMQSRFTGGPRRWLIVPVLGAAAGAALFAVAASANGLSLGFVNPAGNTHSCVKTHTNAAAACAPSLPLKMGRAAVWKGNQPGPLGSIPRFNLPHMAGSPMTAQEQAREAKIQAEMRALGMTPPTRATNPNGPSPSGR